jgi:hypothetical protein
MARALVVRASGSVVILILSVEIETEQLRHLRSWAIPGSG